MPVDPLAAAAAQAKKPPGQPAAAPANQRADDDGTRVISTFLLGLKSRSAALGMQRRINEFDAEPLTAILPGVALLEVWDIVGAAERALFAVSVLVVAVGLAGMLIALLTGLNERRREMAVLRSVGAHPAQVFALILGEALVLTALGVALGVAGLYVGLHLGQSWLETRLGLFVEPTLPSAREWALVASMLLGGALVGLIPAYRSYRNSLADGMTIRL